jgi:Bacterial Ig domain/CARDB
MTRPGGGLVATRISRISLTCGLAVFAAIGVSAGAKPPPKPDLVVSSLSKPPATLRRGVTFKVTDTTKNAGAAKAAKSSTAYYLSLDARRGPGDRRLSPRRAIPGLLKGKLSRGSAKPLVPAQMPRGSYFLLACADDQAKVRESKENNNCRASTTKAVVPNRPPVANPSSISTPEETAKAVKLTGSDPDGDPLTFSIVTQPAHGELTGNGANRVYTPEEDFDDGADSFEFGVSDGRGGTATATVSITVQPVNDAPYLSILGGPLQYSTGQGLVPVATSLFVNDQDSAALAGATVAITDNFHSLEDSLAFTAQNGITGSYNGATGVLALSGSSTVQNYRTALRSVQYQNSSGSPTAVMRTVTFTATDGSAQSAPATTKIAINAPALTLSGPNLFYTEGDGPRQVDPGLTVSDSDSSQLSSATVRLTSVWQPGVDVLSFTPELGISGSFDSATGKLALTGNATKSAYQTALRDVRYSSSSENPPSSRQLGLQATDTAGNQGAEVFRHVVITRVEDRPLVSGTASVLAYREGDGFRTIDTGLTVTDADTAQISGAIVEITDDFRSAQDELRFVDQNGIHGSYDDSAGVLTLAGPASIEAYQSALRSVEYRNISDHPAPGTRTFTFYVPDKSSATNGSHARALSFTQVNDVPTITLNDAPLTYVEGSGPQVIAPRLNVADPDDVNLTGATVAIVTGFRQIADDLSFADQLGISGSYDDTTGTLTLSGTTTVANYQTALRRVKYRNVGHGAAGSSRTVRFRATDQVGGTSTGVAREIEITSGP